MTESYLRLGWPAGRFSLCLAALAAEALVSRLRLLIAAKKAAASEIRKAARCGSSGNPRLPAEGRDTGKP